MSNRARTSEEETRRLIVAITDFLRDQLLHRTDLDTEDRDCLEIAIQCLEMAYGLDHDGYVQLRFARPLLDIFTQVTNPVPIRDKLRADTLKDEGNSLMSRSLYREAETAYTNAIELDRYNSIYYCNRAGARIAQQNYFEAIADCRQALMLNPDYAKSHAKMGQSYALLQRPREAARCFRQALELEPNNERYRNNLRVAENEINRPDAMGLLTNLLTSIFGMNANASGSSNTTLPASFMIITESHPTRHNVQRNENREKGTETQTESHPRDSAHLLRYGVVDEGAEERPVIEMDPQQEADPQNRDAYEEFEFEIPLLGIFSQNQLDSTSEDTTQVHTTSPESEATSISNNDSQGNTNEVSSEKENNVSPNADGYTATESRKDTTDSSERLSSQNATLGKVFGPNAEGIKSRDGTEGNVLVLEQRISVDDGVRDNSEGGNVNKETEQTGKIEGTSVKGEADVNSRSEHTESDANEAKPTIQAVEPSDEEKKDEENAQLKKDVSKKKADEKPLSDDNSNES